MPFFILFFGALLIGGCATLTPSVTEYTISPLTHHPLQSTPISQQTLRIANGQTLPSLNTKNIRYQLSDGESGSYLYSRWSDTPALLIRQSLFTSLEQQGIFAALLATGSSAYSDLLLESDLHTFEHRFFTDKTSAGVIDITYRLIDIRTKHPLAIKRFTLTIPASDNNAQGGVNALQKGVQELNRQSIEWLQVIGKNIK